MAKVLQRIINQFGKRDMTTSALQDLELQIKASRIVAGFYGHRIDPQSFIIHSEKLASTKATGVLIKVYLELGKARKIYR